MKFEKVEKILLADIKTDVKQEIKKLVAAFYNFSQKVGIPCSLILSIKNGEDDEGGGGRWRGFYLKIKTC